MADERRQYEVTIGGITHTMLLDATDAERIGGDAVESKAKPASNKARTTKNKSES